MKTNWKVTYTNNNTLTVNLLEDNLTYNEARKLAKEYNDADKHYIFTAEIMTDK